MSEVRNVRMCPPTFLGSPQRDPLASASIESEREEISSRPVDRVRRGAGLVDREKLVLSRWRLSPTALSGADGRSSASSSRKRSSWCVRGGASCGARGSILLNCERRAVERSLSLNWPTAHARSPMPPPRAYPGGAGWRPRVRRGRRRSNPRVRGAGTWGRGGWHGARTRRPGPRVETRAHPGLDHFWTTDPRKLPRFAASSPIKIGAKRRPFAGERRPWRVGPTRCGTWGRSGSAPRARPCRPRSGPRGAPRGPRGPRPRPTRRPLTPPGRRGTSAGRRPSRRPRGS